MPERRNNKDTIVLAVTSGKGGVGKTNITANLAVCIAAQNQRVTVLDADLGLGNLDVLMNIQPRYNLGHVISGQRTLEQITHIGPNGIEIICGGSGIETLANLNSFQRQRLMEEMEALHNRADVILIDTGAGIHSAVIGFCMAADHTLVVTTPEPTAMTDAYAMIKVLSSKQYPGQISLLVNMACSRIEGKKVYRQISDVAARFLGVPVYEAGILCRDDYLLTAVRQRELVVQAFPKADISRSLEAIGQRLTQGTNKTINKDGFLRKVANWFF
ncbi:MAG TPA: MinD/ParA family protein [Anaerohalosphaeraceae bacterium]|nr:MinD/ParA family protein [Phycisphaerae bacterium]HOK95847.1 MinD/ParA family protein [Anaerohalosphaeraceae bacterium]HOL30408.1 MinD/ParA family protein [Anaerohalosphaeraceae bacterium]HPC65643.1 MinD/ParA family protein [Anaerohalosphaeraceae bacterium]HPO69670.1 MinD/ParA family protein [Anaerohalosphaeraceae bacterium]